MRAIACALVHKRVCATLRANARVHTYFCLLVSRQRGGGGEKKSSTKKRRRGVRGAKSNRRERDWKRQRGEKEREIGRITRLT